MGKKINESTINNNLIQWHCSEFCDYVKFLHSYIGELETNNDEHNAKSRMLIDRQSSLNSEMLLIANDRILALEAELRAAREIISSLTGKVREFVAEKFTPSTEKSRYHKKDGENPENSEKAEEQKQESPEPIDIDKERKKRGVRQGHKGYGRKIPGNLPIEEVVIEIEGEKPCCVICSHEYRRTTKTEDSTKINVKIEQVKELIEMNFGNPLFGLYSIADALKISSSYISRAFKQAYGYGVIEYINRVRIKTAKGLIESGKGNIKSIAIKVGFSSDINFIRVFKKYENITPGKYKNY